LNDTTTDGNSHHLVSQNAADTAVKANKRTRQLTERLEQ
jgi:hypothetical protein